MHLYVSIITTVIDCSDSKCNTLMTTKEIFLIYTDQTPIAINDLQLVGLIQLQYMYVDF